ncbi:MAG: peroxidase family protein [Pseudomonadota bacterium]
MRRGERDDPERRRPDEDEAAPIVVSERTANGAGNNEAAPEWGAAGTELVRLAPSDYADGLSAPSGDDRPSAREVSNAVAEQEGDLPNDEGFSDYLWAWGQFIDHDLVLTEEGESGELFAIEVPAGDPDFDPLATGAVTIPLTRSEPAEGTGDDEPLEHANAITSFLDASMVYGSDDATAAALRDDDGKLLIDGAGLLPASETTGVLAGDVRAAENVALTSLHTLFVREHNHWVDELAETDPTLDADGLYAAARARVEAEIQAITFNEFLPILLGTDAVAEYEGYDSAVDPTISTEFATVAYRFGHSLLSSTLLRIDEQGDTIEAGNLSLADAFFAPDEIAANGGIEPLLRGLGEGVAQELDTMVVEDVRSFLFGEPGAGGLDLAALNIQRGRDHGIPDYNALREALGLDRAATFADITSDTALQQALEETYGDVDSIDAWVGGLAEDVYGDGMLGELFHTVVLDQFVRVRDGDSQWSEAVLPADELAALWETTLSDVIERNSDVGVLQDDAFVAYARTGGTDGDDDLAGGDGRDLLLGEDGSDQLAGGGGEDQLDGGDGDDTLLGEAGDDVLYGSDGDDLLTGGLGDDQLWGGEGNDIFVFEPDFGDDEIGDFEQGDLFDLTAFGDFSTLEDLSFTAGDDALVVTVGDDGSITLAGFDGPDLGPDVFLA